MVNFTGGLPWTYPVLCVKIHAILPELEAPKESTEDKVDETLSARDFEEKQNHTRIWCKFSTKPYFLDKRQYKSFLEHFRKNILKLLKTADYIG